MCVMWKRAVSTHWASPLEQLSLFLNWNRRTTFVQAEQTALWLCLVKEKDPGRFKMHPVPICMLRPINVSWPSHYEHSQPEGGNATLICVLKLLSQAGSSGKCCDYPPRDWRRPPALQTLCHSNRDCPTNIFFYKPDHVQAPYWDCQKKM